MPQEDFFLPCCDHLLGVQKVKKRDKGKLMPEKSLKQVLLEMAKTRTESDAEVGQRIATMLKFVSNRFVLLKDSKIKIKFPCRMSAQSGLCITWPRCTGAEQACAVKP